MRPDPVGVFEVYFLLWFVLGGTIAAAACGFTQDDIAVPAFGSGVSLVIAIFFAFTVVWGQHTSWTNHLSQTADARTRSGISVRSRFLAKHDCDDQLKDASRIVETICKMTAAILGGLDAPTEASELH